MYDEVIHWSVGILACWVWGHEYYIYCATHTGYLSKNWGVRDIIKGGLCSQYPLYCGRISVTSRAVGDHIHYDFLQVSAVHSVTVSIKVFWMLYFFHNNAHILTNHSFSIGDFASEMPPSSTFSSVLQCSACSLCSLRALERPLLVKAALLSPYSSTTSLWPLWCGWEQRQCSCSRNWSLSLSESQNATLSLCLWSAGVSIQCYVCVDFAHLYCLMSWSLSIHHACYFSIQWLPLSQWWYL